jgi:hypothetical protein
MLTCTFWARDDAAQLQQHQRGVIQQVGWCTGAAQYGHRLHGSPFHKEGLLLVCQLCVRFGDGLMFVMWLLIVSSFAMMRAVLLAGQR